MAGGKREKMAAAVAPRGRAALEGALRARDRVPRAALLSAMPLLEDDLRGRGPAPPSALLRARQQPRAGRWTAEKRALWHQRHLRGRALWHLRRSFGPRLTTPTSLRTSSDTFVTSFVDKLLGESATVVDELSGSFAGPFGPRLASPTTLGTSSDTFVTSFVDKLSGTSATLGDELPGTSTTSVDELSGTITTYADELLGTFAGPSGPRLASPTPWRTRSDTFVTSFVDKLSGKSAAFANELSGTSATYADELSGTFGGLFGQRLASPTPWRTGSDTFATSFGNKLSGTSTTFVNELSGTRTTTTDELPGTFAGPSDRGWLHQHP